MENGPFEDVFPIENGDFPASYVRLPECMSILRSTSQAVLKLNILRIFLFPKKKAAWKGIPKAASLPNLEAR